MSIEHKNFALKYIDKRIRDSKDINDALFNVLNIICKFKPQIRTDYENMSGAQLSSNDRFKSVVHFAHGRVDDIQNFKKLKIKVKSTEGMLKVIELKESFKGKWKQ
jgi:hypothetical protein